MSVIKSLRGLRPALPKSRPDLLPKCNVSASLKRMTSSAELSPGAELRLDPSDRSVTLSGGKMMLTPTEFRILERLSSDPGRAFTRAELMAACIAGGAIVLERTIDQHVCGLRRKLGKSEWITTVRRVGYCFQSSATPLADTQRPVTTPSPTAGQPSEQL